MDHDPKTPLQRTESMLSPSLTQQVEIVSLDRNREAPEPCLMVLSGDRSQSGLFFRLTRRTASIGRARDVDVRVNDDSVSRYHAEVRRQTDGTFIIIDLGSTNGTWVNGARAQEHALRPGDRVQLGLHSQVKFDLLDEFQKQFHARLFDLGTRDTDTGVFNRRYFDQMLDKEFSQAVRYGDELCLLRIRIGLGGDTTDPRDDQLQSAVCAVMRRLADIILVRVRKSDVVARLSENELVVILCQTPLGGALRLAESVETLTQNTVFLFREQAIEVPLLIGVVSIDHAQPPESPQAFVSRAQERVSQRPGSTASDPATLDQDPVTQPLELRPHRQDLQAEMAFVLFIDVVGFTKLSMDEQVAVVDDLDHIIKSSNQYRRAQKRDELISLPTGDGVVLAFLHVPEAPVRCATEVTYALRAYPHIQVRMGIHSGPVYRRRDINAKFNAAGGGVNLAERVMSLGDAGHIIVSRAIAEILLELDAWTPHLADLGEHEVKHGLKMHVYNLHGDGFGNASVPAKLQ